MADVHVCEVVDFPESGRKVVDCDGFEVGVFRLGEEYFAWHNYCPHIGGPVCQGRMLPLALEAVEPDGTSTGRVFSKTQMNIICPWHGFEFDIRTGAHPTDRRFRLRRVPVRVVDGAIYVTVPAAQA
jgi:nitrite reductase/ring-hydroxylating ferredoxin subunit